MLCKSGCWSKPLTHMAWNKLNVCCIIHFLKINWASSCSEQWLIFILGHKGNWSCIQLLCLRAEQGAILKLCLNPAQWLWFSVANSQATAHTPFMHMHTHTHTLIPPPCIIDIVDFSPVIFLGLKLFDWKMKSHNVTYLAWIIDACIFPFCFSALPRNVPSSFDVV